MFDNPVGIRFSYSMKEQISPERLAGLIAFARAASLGSYTAAAKVLSLSPSAISKSIRRLEQQLGIALFTRTTRSLILTPEGRELHQRAMRLLHEAEEIEQAAIAARAEPSGVLKVAVPVPIGVHLLAPALPMFRDRYPKLSIDLYLVDRVIDIVAEGVDVAIRIGDLADSRLISRRLPPQRLCAYASPGYLARRGTPRTLDDLNDHDCVNFRFQSTGQIAPWSFRIDGRAMEIIPKANIVVDVVDALTAVAAAGGGVCVAGTYFAAPYVARGALVPILAEFAIDHFPVAALWPESRRNNPNVRAFLTFLDQVLPAMEDR